MVFLVGVTWKQKFCLHVIFSCFHAFRLPLPYLTILLSSRINILSKKKKVIISYIHTYVIFILALFAFLSFPFDEFYL